MSARFTRWALGKLLDARSMEQMIEPLLADASAEHRQAVADGRALEARWIVVRTGWDLAVALIAILAHCIADRARATPWRLPLAGLVVALIGVASLGELGGRQLLQACWLGVAALASPLVLLLPVRWPPARWAWFAIAMLLLASVFFAGQTYDGATRWIAVGPLRLMPSELARPALLLGLAGALATGRRPLVEGALITALGAAAIAWQPDPAAVLVLLVAAAVMISQTAGFGRAALAMAPATAAAWAVAVVRGASIRSMWTAWTSTAAEPATDTDLWLAGMQARFGIAAALIALLLIGLLAHEVWASTREAGPSRTFARGAAAALMAQAALHALGALGLLPPSTLGLPLLSYGGSGMVGWMLCLMIVARASGSGYRGSQPSTWQMQ